LVHQQLEAKPYTGFNRAVRFCGFLLSAGTIYLMIIWTLELSQVEVDDLPVIRALEPNFKKKPPEESQKIINNSDLSINTLRGNESSAEDDTVIVLAPFEETLTAEEKSVTLSMQEALVNSITEALTRLEENDIISQDRIYQVYLGSFESHGAALEKLRTISAIRELSISKSFNIVSGKLGTKNFYRLETIDMYTYEQAKQICNGFISQDLDCKIISG